MIALIRGNLRTEKLSKLSKITWLVSSEAGIRTQIVFRVCTFNYYSNRPFVINILTCTLFFVLFFIFMSWIFPCNQILFCRFFSIQYVVIKIITFLILPFNSSHSVLLIVLISFACFINIIIQYVLFCVCLLLPD